VLRCWSPTDAPRVRRVLDQSDAYLRPFIPFMVSEPRSLPDTVTWLRRHRACFDRDQHYWYAIFDPTEATLMGETMLLDRADDGQREVGYWLAPEHAGHGYATEVAAAMTRLAFELDGVDRVEIQCAPENTRSVAVARRLGYLHEATLARRITDTDGEVRDLMIWVMFRTRYPGSPPHALAMRAFDCLGAPLPLGPTGPANSARKL
jgi:RimJ/RimL family protein N-acetyltransferase